MVLVFFFNDTATTDIYTLSLHDALPIWNRRGSRRSSPRGRSADRGGGRDRNDRGSGRPAQPAREPPPERLGLGHRRQVVEGEDRKSTRLNSRHANISYAVFCLKKKKLSL